MGYSTLSAPVQMELEEKRSRFITYLQPVASRAEALNFLDALKQQYPDARHHCWAYVVGNPASAAELACSDDGEPSGTAGKPILNVLQHRALGNCMAVVVRYFGGIKLGAGGLVRAYSAAVSQAVDAAALIPYVAQVRLQIDCDYDQEARVRHALAQFSAAVVDASYGDRVLLVASVAANLREDCAAVLAELGQGRLQLRELR